MKMQKQRFEKAFIKLQNEVHTKAKRCIDNKIPSPRLILKSLGPLDISEAAYPEPTGFQLKNSENFTQRTLKNSFIKIHQPSPRSPRFSPRFSLRNSVKTPMASTSPIIDIQPTDPNAPLPWNARNVLDLKHLESNLSTTTARLHKLIDPLSQSNPNDAKDFWPIDVFDCQYQMPKDEILLREEGIPAKGEAFITDVDGSMSWKPVNITFFDSEKCLFYVENQIIKQNRYVSRFKIHFEGENIKVLKKREFMSAKIKNDYEKHIRTDCFLDSIPDPPDLFDFLPEKMLNKLTPEAKEETGRIAKMLIFRGMVKLNEQEDLSQTLINLGGDINQYSPTPLKQPFITQTSYFKSLRKIENSIVLINDRVYLAAVQSLLDRLYVKKMEICDYTDNFFTKNQLTVSEWKEKQNEYKNFMHESLLQLSNDLSNVLFVILSGVLNVGKIEELEKFRGSLPPIQFLMRDDTKFNRFYCLYRNAFYNFGKDIIEHLFHLFIDFINFPINFSTPIETTVNGYTTLTQSIADESISSRKPFLIIDLETKKEDITEVFSLYHNICDNELNSIINPMRVMFEGADVKTVIKYNKSRFETFCVDHKLGDRIPPTTVFGKGEINPVVEGTMDVMMQRLYVTLNDLYKRIPILEKFSKKAIDHFKKFEKPEYQNVISVITKMRADKDVFMFNFPYEIWLSFSKLDFTKTRTTVLETFKNFRESVLKDIQDTINGKIVIIDNGYKEIIKSLSIFPNTSAKWIMLNRNALGTFAKRKDLELETEMVKTLSEILFEENYGHFYEDQAKEMNLIMWPILTDIELGKALALLMKTKDELLESLKPQIKNIETEIIEKSAVFKSCEDEYQRMQGQEYIKIITKKLETFRQHEKEFKEANFLNFSSPRVNLWIIIKLSQELIEKWVSTTISKLDYNEIKSICTEWLKKLRKLTSSFSKDKRSLRLLIQTKNDIESIMPIFKACMQSLTPKLLQTHRKDIVEIIGDEKFEEMTINELIKIGISQKLDAIDKLYKQTKLEDKANYEIIEVQTILKTVKFELEGDNITNISAMLKVFNDKKSSMLMIETTEGIDEKKRLLSRQLFQKLVQHVSIVELFSSVQDMMSEIRPIQSVDNIDFDFSIITKVKNSYDSILDSIKNNPLVEPFTESYIIEQTLKDIKESLKDAKDQVLKLLLSIRRNNPRLLLVPDSQLIKVFTNEIKAKLDVFPILFPGTVAFEVNKKKHLSKIIFPLEDEISVVKRFSLSKDVISLIPMIEKAITESMRSAFMHFYKENKDPTKLPFQLIALRLLIDPNYDIDTSSMNYEKKKAVEIFKASLMSCKVYPHARVEGDKVFVFVDKKEVEYQFQISSVNSFLFTKTLFAILSDMLVSINKNPLLCSSELYSSSSLICQQYSFIIGRYCSIIHATSSTTICRLSSIIDNLNSIKVMVCLTETELLSEKQMFELAMHANSFYFLTITTQMIPPILSVNKDVFTISSDAFKNHVLTAGKLAYEYQPDAINFACSTLTNYVHPYAILKYIEKQIHEESVAFDLNFIANFTNLLPEKIYSIVKDTISDVTIDESYRINLAKTTISTTDFLKGVQKIISSIVDGNKMILVEGQQFSGISSCVIAASQALGMKYISVAFASDNWIKELNQTLVSLEPKETIFHVMIPFNASFLSHVSALSFGSSICEGKENLLKVSDKIVLVFEVMTPLTTPSLVSAPIILFDAPVVKSGDLLNYWLVNIKAPVSPDSILKIKEIVNSMIPADLQILIFFWLFKAFITQIPQQNSGSLRFLVMYCMFWSNTYKFKKLSEWIEYSKSVNEKMNMFHNNTLIFDLSIAKGDQFMLENLFNNPNTYQNNPTLHLNYNRWICGPVSQTIIPTTQFTHGIEIIPRMVDSDISVAIIGKHGCGKTLLANYLVNHHFCEPEYNTIRIDGTSTTPSTLLKCILRICQLTPDGIVEPKHAKRALVLVDPFSTSSALYGTILSMINTGNAIIDDEIYTFSNVFFMLVLDERPYQIISCCFPYIIQPYTDEDLKFITLETIARIMTSYSSSPQSIKKATNRVKNVFSEFVKRLRKVKENRLEIFFRIIRSVEMLDFSDDSVEIDDFLFMKLYHYEEEVEYDGVDFKLGYVHDTLNNVNTFRYIKDSDPKIFEKSLRSKVIFSHNANLDSSMLKFAELLINLCCAPHSNLIVVDDLNIDYEFVTKYVAAALSAKFETYNDPQQIAGLIYDSIATKQLTLVYVRRLEPTIIDILCNGIKSNQVNFFNLIASDDNFTPEDGAGNQFPLAMLSKPTEEVNPQREINMENTFGFFDFHAFTNIHFVFSIQDIADIKESFLPKFFLWDNRDAVIETGNKNVDLLLQTISTHNEEAIVPVFAQFTKVTTVNKYLSEKLGEFIKNRHSFLKEVTSVITSLEKSMGDSEKRIKKYKDQIRIDRDMLESAKKAVDNASSIVSSITIEKKKAEAEYELICQKAKELSDYFENDAEKTEEVYKKALFRASRAYTAEEQYKLYCNQNPSDDVRELFNAFCTLLDFTPREGNDFWPEARGLLKSSRMPQILQIFDHNNVSNECLEKFYTAMKKVSDLKFRKGSSHQKLLDWLKAVLYHSKRTHFNPSVNTEITQVKIEKASKEEELQEVNRKLERAQKNVADLTVSMDDLKEKIEKESILLDNVLLFSEISKKISKVFPILKKDLNDFTDGESLYGANADGFILKSSHELVTRSLFDPVTVKSVDVDVTEMMMNNNIESKYYTSIKEIIGTNDPLVTSLLSGDRIITVYDPYGVAAELTGYNNATPHQNLSHISFVYADDLDDRNETCQKITEAAEKGKILVVSHADELVSHTFFCSAANQTTVSALFNKATISIDSDFKAVLLVDHPPEWMPAHMSFISELELDKNYIYSALASDKSLKEASDKLKTSELAVIQQKDNLYLSLQNLNPFIKEIHSTMATLLKDPELQTTLYLNMREALNNDILSNMHALDDNKWIIDVTPQIVNFCGKLQSLYKYSSLYLWTLQKIMEIFKHAHKCGKANKTDIFKFLYSRVAATMLRTHRSKIEELKAIKPPTVFEILDEAKKDGKKLFIFHCDDLSVSAKFFTKLNISTKAQFFVSDIDNENIILPMKRAIDNAEFPDIVVSLFGGTKELIYKVCMTFLKYSTSDKKIPNIYIHINTSFKIPASIIKASVVIALN